MKKIKISKTIFAIKLHPSKDLTISPPKLKLQAPRKTNKGPGSFVIMFIKFVKVNSEFPSHTT